MAVARNRQVSLVDTPYYHCISRCVRRAFLCGEDPVTGKNYEHRRGWVEDELLALAKVFAIDICAYAVMSNHVHIVLFVNQQNADSWPLDEVLSRWHELFKGTLLTQQYLRGDLLSKPLMEMVEQTAAQYRQRLMDISWFMRILNEHIARKANQEDDCTGRFWEGRFKSQALLDEKALAACMAYVDLNPIRAGIATSPESSKYTSIQRRITFALKGKQPKTLQAFVGNPRQQMPQGLPFVLTDYIELVELTGRCIREDKTGYIREKLPSLLARLQISKKNWLKLTLDFSRCFHGAVGDCDALSNYCENKHLKRRPNLSQCQQLLA
ncbi:transposase [Endozoicomonas sp. G2_1]|uniref:transposase n=1 Tax=Endozoicomonas sp. G2_1 TaxID=2821091 RepID=UPI001ADD2D4A|nr:transposase [Endozoicomonas sp. G2_1]MBO9489464.1 transposase [Endozoicomonas sp. G2_1]